jgi:hypothetical protein
MPDGGFFVLSDSAGSGLWLTEYAVDTPLQAPRQIPSAEDSVTPNPITAAFNSFLSSHLLS